MALGDPTVSGYDLASSRYPYGTPAWSEALSLDLSQGLLTKAQYDWALQNPGMAIPINPPEPSGWSLTGIISGLTSTADVIMSAVLKREKMDYERDLLQLDIERRRQQLESGMPGQVGFGGINMYTLVALAGVALLAMLLLKKPS